MAECDLIRLCLVVCQPTYAKEDRCIVGSTCQVLQKERIFQRRLHADREMARMSCGRCLPRTVQPFVPDEGSASPRGHVGPFSPPLHELARAGLLLCPEAAPVLSCSAPDALRHELLHPEVTPAASSFDATPIPSCSALDVCRPELLRLEVAPPRLARADRLELRRRAGPELLRPNACWLELLRRSSSSPPSSTRRWPGSSSSAGGAHPRRSPRPVLLRASAARLLLSLPRHASHRRSSVANAAMRENMWICGAREGDSSLRSPLDALQYTSSTHFRLFADTARHSLSWDFPAGPRRSSRMGAFLFCCARRRLA
jgi:hypothetical protein